MTKYGTGKRRSAVLRLREQLPNCCPSGRLTCFSKSSRLFIFLYHMFHYFQYLQQTQKWFILNVGLRDATPRQHAHATSLRTGLKKFERPNRPDSLSQHTPPFKAHLSPDWRRLATITAANSLLYPHAAGNRSARRWRRRRQRQRRADGHLPASTPLLSGCARDGRRRRRRSARQSRRRRPPAATVRARYALT